MFSSRFMLFPTFTIFFFWKTPFLMHFAFYAIFNITKKKGNIEKFPFTYWLNREVLSPISR